MSRAGSSIDPLRERLLAAELSQARSIYGERGASGLISTASSSLRDVEAARQRFHALTLELELAPGSARSDIVERYLRDTAAGTEALRGDLRALARAEVGVFDVAALGERLARQNDALECRAEACLALARVTSDALELELIDPLVELALTSGRWSRRIEAIRSLTVVKVAALQASQRARIQAALVLLTSPAEQRWLQAEALAALATFDSAAAQSIAHERLLHPLPGDDFLVRAGIVSLVGLRRHAHWPEILRLAHDDPSEHVRITAARVETSAAELERVSRADPSHRVRACALIRLAKRHPAVSGAALAYSLANDAHGFVVQTAAEELARLARRERIDLAASLFSALTKAAARTELLPTVRGVCRDVLIELQAIHELSRSVLEELRAAVAQTPIGGSTLVSGRRLVGLSEDALGRALAVVARNDFGVGVERRAGTLVFHRGERRARSLWRLLFELLHPAPDKRQGVSHVIARRMPGALRAPPGGLAEATATRVPGQRVFSATHGDWGRELPRVEDLIAQGVLVASSTRIASSVGITTVSSPASLARRVKGFCSLVLGYAAFAESRQRALDSDDPLVQASYAQAVFERTGTRIEIVPYAFDLRSAPQTERSAVIGTSATALVPALPASPVDALNSLWQTLREVAAPHSVGLPHLAGYGALLLGVLVGRQMLVRREIAAKRAAIPLVMGGWGTRGKSGTERLKAALFQGLGYECLVKTTGCEAMFIHAIPGLPAREIFIYRPYDKPTIWEQHSVLSLASRLGVRVFLWECMALQPDLVNLLQSQWMRDDVSTITNAYPDHEDMQGPSGLDVAETIAEFIPERGSLFTTEVQMLPLMKAQAAARGTRLVSVSPREAELIAGDLRARFGHDEHPANIALVAALARRAGVSETVAIAEMADHVVADLGALKTYPTVSWRGRALTFTNGMGANDRAATLENWQRAGFEAGPSALPPQGWVITLVNNRADRPARTVVFAQLLVKDISADRHVVIGTNLAGMLRALDQALDEHLVALSPTRDVPEAAELRQDVIDERLASAFRRLRICGTDLSSAQREAARRGVLLPSVAVVERLLSPLGVESYEIAKQRVAEGLHAAGWHEEVAFVVSIIARRRVVRSLRALARAGDAGASLGIQFASAYRAIFLEGVETFPDPEMSGDAIIDQLASQLPIGGKARIMGLQNIKGTGLDFVYRWVSVETVHRLCKQLESLDEVARREALIALMVHDDYGVVDATLARDVVERIGQRDTVNDLPYAAAHRKLSALAAQRAAPLGANPRKRWVGRVRQLLGETLDFADAVRRRGMAARVINALANGEISHATAALRMRSILRRSKGHWLVPRDERR